MFSLFPVFAHLFPFVYVGVIKLQQDYSTFSFHGKIERLILSLRMSKKSIYRVMKENKKQEYIFLSF